MKKLALLVSVGVALSLGGSGSPAWAMPPAITSGLSQCQKCNIHVSESAIGQHQHYFTTTSTITVGNSDYIYAWVYLESTNPPKQVMMQAYSGGAWRRAWWGVDSNSTDLLANTGYYGGGGFYGGQLSSTGGWVRISVQKSLLGGTSIVSGMAFTLYDGSAYWGEAGYQVGSATATEHVWVGDQVPGTVNYYADHGDRWLWRPFYRRSWLQFGGNSIHSNNNEDEARIGIDNVFGLAQTGRTFPSTEVGPIVRASASGNDMFYTNGRSTAVLTATNLITNTSLQQSTTGGRQGQATPALDPDRMRYVYNVGRDGCVHKYDATDLTELKGPGAGTPAGSAPGCYGPGSTTATGFGWPQLLTQKPNDNCQGRTALTVGTSGQVGRLYAGVSCNDIGNGDGNLTTIELNSTGTQRVFNSNGSTLTDHCPAAGCGISLSSGFWARGGVLFDNITQRVFATTGDGAFNPNDGTQPNRYTWGYSVLGLNANGTGTGVNGFPVDSFTPSSYGGDQDLGSTNFAIVPGNLAYPNVLITSGGDGKARVLNLTSLGGGTMGYMDGQLGAPLKLETLLGITTCGSSECKPVSPIATWTNPADYSTWVFIMAPNGLNALQLVPNNGGEPFLLYKWTITTPSVNKSGVHVANNVLYYADSTALHAVNPATKVEKWSDTSNSVGIGTSGHPTPLVVNGVLYFQSKIYTIAGIAPNAEYPLVNLAERQPTWLSSVYGSWTGDLAVDGNTAGNIGDNTTFHTTNAACTMITGKTGGPCFTVDLGGMRNVKKILLHNRKDCCADRISNFWIGGHNAGGWFLASDQSAFVASTVTPVVSVSFTSFTTDQILIQKANSGGDNYLNLAEVQVFGQ